MPNNYLTINLKEHRHMYFCKLVSLIEMFYYCTMLEWIQWICFVYFTWY